MPDSKEPYQLDAMIARLEEANARAHEQFARADETVFKSEQDVARHPSERQKPPAVPDRQSTRSRPALLALIALPLAASACVAAFAWQSSYGDAAKLTGARWATSLLPQPAPLTPTTSQDVPGAAPMFPELAQRVQMMARDLANMEQQIEQLKTSQEQMVRDNTAIAEQLKAALAQKVRDNAAVAEQLKASQEQLAVVMSFWTAAGSAQKPLRIRKPVPLLPSPQARAHPQAPGQ
jgi:septal ring factor EnvC (AmiA/AmiB activator)